MLLWSLYRGLWTCIRPLENVSKNALIKLSSGDGFCLFSIYLLMISITKLTTLSCSWVLSFRKKLLKQILSNSNFIWKTLKMVWKLLEISIMFCHCFRLLSFFVSMLNKSTTKKKKDHGREKSNRLYTIFKRRSNTASFIETTMYFTFHNTCWQSSEIKPSSAKMFQFELKTRNVTGPEAR